MTGPLDLPGGQSRLDGYRDVLGPSYDPALVAEGNYTQESGEAAMSALLDRAPELDAVFVASDVMARRALVARHQRVPPRPADAPVSSFPDAIGE